ncbi:MAG: 1-phosphofructokinase family hexose kinase [Ramlibacter sp.]
MAAILTVTLNPALDVWTSTARVEPTHKLRCAAAQMHPGGGGINVARVLQRLGSDCLAVFAAGGETGNVLRRMLAKEQVPGRCIPIAGETRESFTAHETSTGRDFRFVLPGPELATGEWQAFLDFAQSCTPVPRYIVASGSLPPGVPVDFYARLARIARTRGSRFVLDASGPALATALAEGVYLAKPSLGELRQLTGAPLETEAQWRAAAEGLVGEGRAQIVALSLGEQGALLVSKEGALRAPAVPVNVSSTVGAGDSFLGGLVHALDRGEALKDALREAVAAGAAALLSEGTALCRAEDIEALRGSVVIV